MVVVGRGSHELGLERWARFQQLEGGEGVPGMGKGMSSCESVGHGLGEEEGKARRQRYTQSHGILIAFLRRSFPLPFPDFR